MRRLLKRVAFVGIVGAVAKKVMESRSGSKPKSSSGSWPAVKTPSGSGTS